MAGRDEASAAQSWSPVRWVTHVVRHQQLPAAGYAFGHPQSSITEIKVDQVSLNCAVCSWLCLPQMLSVLMHLLSHDHL